MLWHIAQNKYLADCLAGVSPSLSDVAKLAESSNVVSMLDLPKYATRAETAAQLLLSLRQVDRLIKSGDLERVKLGKKRTGIPHAAIEQYLARNQPPSRPGASYFGVRMALLVINLDSPLNQERYDGLDLFIGENFPGCLPFSEGKQIRIFWAWSLLYTAEEITARVKEMAGQ